MPRPRAIVDLAVATTGGLFSFYAWSLLGTLALFHLWLPAVETQVSFFRSVGLMHPAYVILAARDLLLAAVLGSVAGLLFGWILRISSRAFAAAFAVGLVAGLIVTNSTDGGSDNSCLASPAGWVLGHANCCMARLRVRFPKEAFAKCGLTRRSTRTSRMRALRAPQRAAG